MPKLPIKSPMMGFEKSKAWTTNYNNERVTCVIGDKTCCFRSKLEHNWARWLQFQKSQGMINNWAFEQTRFEFRDELTGPKVFLVDFDILNNDGTFEYHECKGWLQGRDVSKFRRVAKYRPEVKISLVMIGKRKRDANRLRIISKYAHRIIYAPDVLGKMKGILNLI